MDLPSSLPSSLHLGLEEIPVSVAKCAVEAGGVTAPDLSPGDEAARGDNCGWSGNNNRG